jgi:hypothetical protein
MASHIAEDLVTVKGYISFHDYFLSLKSILETSPHEYYHYYTEDSAYSTPILLQRVH